MHANNVRPLFQLVQSGWIIERVMHKDSVHSMVTYISQVLHTATVLWSRRPKMWPFSACREFFYSATRNLFSCRYTATHSNRTMIKNWCPQPLVTFATQHLSAVLHCCQWPTVASPAMGHWGMCPSSTSNNFILSSLWSESESQLSKYCVVCEIRWMVQTSTTHSSFESISTALITKYSHRAAAALGAEVRRECPMT